MQVTAQLKDKPETAVTVEYNFGSSIADAISKFGEDVVFSAFEDAAVIKCQALMRRLITKGDKPAAIQTAISAWKPQPRAEAKAPTVESVLAKASKLSPEQRKALLDSLKKAA